MTTGSIRPGSTFCVLRVERLAELHDVDAVLAQCRPDRGAGVGFACRDLQLDETDYLLCHLSLLVGAGGLAPSPANHQCINA
jgi:hypothetical protein